jgi:hypothetical protein
MTFEPRKLALGMTLLAALSVPGCRQSTEAKATGPEGRVTQGRARGESAAAHLTLTGAYQNDSAALAVCTLNPDKAFQVTFHAPGQPEVVLRLENFKGAGTYTGEVRVRGTYTGDSYRTSKGAPPVTVTVVPGQPNSLVSGSFRTTEYKGESGTGTVSGSFERCPYELTVPDSL